jgi:hypothetical protein
LPTKEQKDMEGNAPVPKSNRKHKRSFLNNVLRKLGIGKKKSHRISRSGSIYKRDFNEAQVLSNPAGPSDETTHQKPSKNSKTKYKRAIQKRKKRERRKHLKLRWVQKWQDTLYYLNLRDQPFDPFGKREDSSESNKSNVMTIRQYVVYIFNSTVLFLIAYVIAYLTYQLTVIFVASFFGIDSVLYYYEVMFPIGNGSSLWTPYNIILITLSGPMVSLIMGLVYYKLFLPKDGFGPVARLFFLWLSFHSFNMFFGAYVAGVITDQGFGFVANWLFLGVIIKLTIALLSVFTLMVIGYFATKPLLETSNSSQRVSKNNRPYFILNQALIPWLIGGFILVLIKIPDKQPQHENIIVYDLIVLSTLVFTVLPTFFNNKAKADKLKIKAKRRIKFVWLFMLVAILLVLAYRLGLADGLYFYIRMAFRVAPYG